MSNSRLEKFIYAICSMEVSDLPTPLSRIEILWNCLITGETPDFEPQSRNEQYLMAMLGLYELENLPTPMSRGEKLLYKIAVGETDLSDVPGYLSRYEELLKYLIENGVLSDFEYVLYTLNQSLSTLYATVEKPVKSAILKGQTLVNLINFNSIYGASNNGVKTLITKNNDGILEYTTTNTWNQTAILFEDIQFKPNTTYTIMYIPIENDGYETASKIEIRQNNNALLQTAKSKGKFSTTDNIEQITMSIGSSITSGFTIKKMKIKNVMLLEGDYTNVDIPYFEGMQSVKMPVLTTTGKNLFDDKWEYGSFFVDSGMPSDTTVSIRTVNYIKVKPNTNYIASSSQLMSKNVIVWLFYDENKNYINTVIDSNQIITPSNCYYIKARTLKNDEPNLTLDCNLQIEQGSTATTYEPYKSNILSTSEDVTLRGIDDVKDTLDGNTGELTQRIGEDIFNGSEDWTKLDLDSHPNGYYLKQHNSKNKGKVLTDKIKTVYSFNKDTTEAIYKGISMSIFPPADINELTLFKQWLSQNPITVQYELAAPTIKTVDLTTIDQDGQPTKLKTFNDITYVEINSDNIIPSVDVEVATKISETLSTMGPQQLDISETQNKLGQTIEEQTENTDATMMATTEIYEQIL